MMALLAEVSYIEILLRYAYLSASCTRMKHFPVRCHRIVIECLGCCNFTLANEELPMTMMEAWKNGPRLQETWILAIRQIENSITVGRVS
jgi:hypothetical protein